MGSAIFGTGERPVLASFVGRFKKHPIRKYVAELVHNGQDVFIEDVIDDTLYERYLHSSTFGLILRGDDRWSFRFNDIVCSGSIPVLVTDIMVPPFNEIVPFEEYGILIKEEKIALAGMIES